MAWFGVNRKRCLRVVIDGYRHLGTATHCYCNTRGGYWPRLAFKSGFLSKLQRFLVLQLPREGRFMPTLTQQISHKERIRDQEKKGSGIRNTFLRFWVLAPSAFVHRGGFGLDAFPITGCHGNQLAALHRLPSW